MQNIPVLVSAKVAGKDVAVINLNEASFFRSSIAMSMYANTSVASD